MDVELNKAESDLQSEESGLHAELTKLSSVSAELGARLAAVQARAQSAGDAAMAQRSAKGLPAVDERWLQGAREARVAAIQARQKVNDQVRQQLVAMKGALQKLSQQVITDEKSLGEREAAAKAAAVAAPVAAVAPPPPAPKPVRAPPQEAAPKKRHSPRVRMQAQVDIHSDNNFFNGFSANISDGGLFVATVDLLPLGTEVDLSFTLPSGEKVDAKGVVRWVREVNDQLPDSFPGLGVQFASLSPDAQNAINEFLAEREPLFYAD